MFLQKSQSRLALLTIKKLPLPRHLTPAPLRGWVRHTETNSWHLQAIVELERSDSHFDSSSSFQEFQSLVEYDCLQNRIPRLRMMGKRAPSIYESRPCPQLREQNPDLASQIGRLRRASAKAPRPSVEMVQSKTGLTAWGRHRPDSSQGEISPSSTSFGLPSAEGAASGKPVHFSVGLFEMDRSQSPSTPNVMHALKARLYAHVHVCMQYYHMKGRGCLLLQDSFESVTQQRWRSLRLA